MVEKQTRKQVLVKHNNTCFYCKTPTLRNVREDHPQRTTIEHRIPKFLGGGDNIDNLCVACRACNNERGVSLNRLIQENNGNKILISREYAAIYPDTTEVLTSNEKKSKVVPKRQHFDKFVVITGQRDQAIAKLRLYEQMSILEFILLRLSRKKCIPASFSLSCKKIQTMIEKLLYFRYTQKNMAIVHRGEKNESEGHHGQRRIPERYIQRAS